jgi:hypothetical protein
MRRFPKGHPNNPLVATGNPQFKQLSKNEVVIVPDRAIVLEDALKVAWVELGRMKTKQQAGIVLSTAEVRTIAALADVVAKLSKEQREQEKGWNPEHLEDDEALAQLEAAAAALKEKMKAKKAKEIKNEG